MLSLRHAHCHSHDDERIGRIDHAVAVDIGAGKIERVGSDKAHGKAQDEERVEGIDYAVAVGVAVGLDIAARVDHVIDVPSVVLVGGRIILCNSLNHKLGCTIGINRLLLHAFSYGHFVRNAVSCTG